MTYRPHDVEWTPEKVERLWGHYASIDAFRPFYFSAHSGAAIVARVDSVVGLAGKRVLDFGAGHGDLLAQLFARGVAASGVELSEKSAASARTRFADEPLSRGIAVGPSLYGDGSFDIVFLVEVVEHLLDDEIEPTVHEVERLLAPGGHVVVTAPNAEELVYEDVHCPDCGATFHRWQHQRSLTPGAIEAMFHGFEPVRAEALDWREAKRARLRRLLGRGGPRPHLLYVGRRPVSSIPLPP